MKRLLIIALLFNFTYASTCWSDEVPPSVVPDHALRASIHVLKAAHESERCAQSMTDCDARQLRRDGLRTTLGAGAVIVLTVGSLKIAERAGAAATVATIRQVARLLIPTAIAAGALGGLMVVGSYLIANTPAAAAELTDEMLVDEAHFARLLRLPEHDIHVIASHRPRLAAILVRSAAAILAPADEPSSF